MASEEVSTAEAAKISRENVTRWLEESDEVGAPIRRTLSAEALDDEEIRPTPPQSVGSPTRDAEINYTQSLEESAEVDVPIRRTLSAETFDSNESRPTSPHNISSPSKEWGNGTNFMSVPGARSRGNSLDSATSGSWSIASVVHGDYDKDLVNDIVNNRHDALKPDPGTEQAFEVENNPFAFSPGQLSKMFNPKSLGAFYALGGLSGLEKGLRTSWMAGLSVDEQNLEGIVSFQEATFLKEKDTLHLTDVLNRRETAISYQNSDRNFADRIRVFSDGRIPSRRPRSLLRQALSEYCDTVLILLTVAALVTIALGVYQSSAQDTQNGTFNWPEGTAICVAIVIVVLLETFKEWRKEWHFVKLNAQADPFSLPTKVLRSGRILKVSWSDVLVGDVVYFEAGDELLADGVFIHGHDVHCDESSATGESDLLKKTGAMKSFKAIEHHENLKKIDPFMVSGGKVHRGRGCYLVTSTGIHSLFGRILMSIREDCDGYCETPLQKKLNLLSNTVARCGLVIAVLLFITLFIKFLVRQKGSLESGTSKGLRFLYIFTIAVTIVDVAIPSGLPLAQTVALALATSRMLKDKILVRHIWACEALGYTTAICTDDSDVLLDVGGAVDALIFGDESGAQGPSIIRKFEAGAEVEIQAATEKQERLPGIENSSCELAKQASVATTTAVQNANLGATENFVGSPKEIALLQFTQKYLRCLSIPEERESIVIRKIHQFSEDAWGIAVFTILPSGRYRVFVRCQGTEMLTSFVNLEKPLAQSTNATDTGGDDTTSIEAAVHQISTGPRSVIGFAYKDFEPGPLHKIKETPGTELPYYWNPRTILRDMTILSIVAIPLVIKSNTKASVEACQRAGIYVRMISSENASTCKAIADATGIFLPRGVIMEGPDFRRLSRRDMDAITPKLVVLARASPEDKRGLIKKLIELQEKVLAIGNGRAADDRPAFKTSTVSAVVDHSTTDMIREAASIILSDDPFAAAFQAIMWGRAVSDSVQKFLQFQLTINISAVVLSFVSSILHESQQSVLNSVQLLWVNLIMDLFAILALANDPPSRNHRNRKPLHGRNSLVTLTMWKMIVGQTIFQLGISLALYHTDLGFLGYQLELSWADRDTLVFNTFVWMQIFNQLNCRRVDNHFNVFEGIASNMLFPSITVVIMGVQFLLIFFGGPVMNIIKLSWKQWVFSVSMGIATLPLACALRCLPDAWVQKGIPARLLRYKSKKPEIISDNETWDQGLLEIRDELRFLKKLRGGRLRKIRYTPWAYRQRLNDSDGLSGSRRNSASGDLEAGRHRGSSAGVRARSASAGSATGMSLSSFGSGVRQRRYSRPHSISSAVSVPGVVAGAVAISSPGRRARDNPFGAPSVMAGIVAGSIAAEWSPIDKPHGTDKFEKDV